MSVDSILGILEGHCSRAKVWGLDVEEDIIEFESTYFSLKNASIVFDLPIMQSKIFRNSKKTYLGKLPFAPMNYKALALSPHELPIVLLCPHELLFYDQKLIPSVKSINSNSQSVTLHHFVPMNYNALSLYPHEL